MTFHQETSEQAGEARLLGLARGAGFRIEPSSVAGLWLLIDPDGELVRTPAGGNALSCAAAEHHIRAVAPRARSTPNDFIAAKLVQAHVGRDRAPTYRAAPIRGGGALASRSDSIRRSSGERTVTFIPARA